jgi:endonuclease G
MVSILFIITTVTFSKNNTIKVEYSYYTSYFDTVLNYPTMVTWWLTKEMIGCAEGHKRKNNFKTCKKTNINLDKYYTKSGYDRGHNMPANHNRCSDIGLDESFYFINMTPQHPSLNRGTWNKKEQEEFDTCNIYDSLFIICGSVGSIKTIGKMSVPQYCWRVYHIKKTNRYYGYIFSNDSTCSVTPATINKIKKLSGINIKEVFKNSIKYK